MRRWLVWSVVGCVLIAAPAAGAKTPRARPIDVSIEPDGTPYHSSGSQTGAFLVSDGRRYFAFKRTTTTLRVYDGSTRRLFDYEIGPRCTPMDIGSRHVLLSCQDPSDASGTTFVGPRLLNIATRRLSSITLPPDHEGRYPGPEGDTFFRVGRYWLQGWRRTGAPPVTPVYVNWRTGEFREPGDEAARDIDSRGLVPLPYSWKEGRKIYGRSRGYELTDGPYDRGTASLILRGHGSTFKVSRCQNGLCASRNLDSGIATWAQLNRAYAYLLSTRRRIRWKFRTPEGRFRTDDFAIVHTKREVVFVVRRPTASSDPDRYRIYAARVKR